MDELIAELKRQGVLSSPYVEAAFRAIDRADFVPPEYQAEAYGNYPLPIGHSQTISQPYTVAFMLDLLDPQPGEHILDIGAGSGWQTTLLAHIVSQQSSQKTNAERQTPGKVYAVERIPELCDLARANVARYNFLSRGIVELRCQDASRGVPEGAPFDKIIAAASAREMPAAWQAELNTGGVIVAPVGSSIRRYRNRGEGDWQIEEFPGFAFVPLVDGKNSEEEPVSKRRDATANGRKTLLSLSLLSVAVLAAGAYTMFAPVALAEPARITIAPGLGSRAIAARLKSHGIIRSSWAFVTYATITGSAASLKPGTYDFSGHAGVPAIVRTLVRGEANEYTITIPEGWDLRDIGRYLEERGIVSRNDLYAITGRPAGTLASAPSPDSSLNVPPSVAARPRESILEGYLYPDTYRIFRSASARDIVQKMVDTFERKIAPELRAEAARQGRSASDVLIMASLIEEEVADPEERRIIAGILWQRLKDGVALGVDASVNYATGKRETPSAEDLLLDSPYNTYRRAGLPPTPISNPGLEAVRAALSSLPSDYRYYLSSPDGRTVFSRTLEEHARAKAVHLRR